MIFKKNHKTSVLENIEFKKLVELLPEIIVRTDKDFNITFLNKHGLEIIGYTNKDIIKGLNIFEVLKKKEKSKARKNIKKLKNRQKIGLNEYAVIKKDGSSFSVLANSNVIEDSSGNFSGLRIVAMDLTEKKNSEEKFKENEQKYQLLAENVSDIIFVQDMALNITYASPSAFKVCGYVNEDMPRIKMKDIVTEDSYKKLISSFKKSADFIKKGIDIEVPLMEYEYIRKDGSTFWGELKVGFLRDLNGSITGILGVLRDVTERKKAEEKLKYISFHDNLTGLYSRSYFEKELERLDTKRQLPLSIIIGDLNGLKLVNDVFGHLKGDQYLNQIGKILKEYCRAEDIVARWGGDEFSILLPKTKSKIAYEIIKRIKDAVNEIKMDGIPLSISFGTSTKRNKNIDTRTLIQYAESNMYGNKLVEKRSLVSSIISTLERTLWEKSHETADHAQRIKELSTKLGNYLGLYQNKIDELILLSSLHDIGKVAIPEDILSKNGKLTKLEWEKIKKHPEVGYNICLSSPQLAIIADAVLAHHERWDGSGYPHGLKGETIPITSRILSVVDSYDVMVSGRNYKKPISKSKAVMEIKKYSGKQFDPKIVEKFIEIVKKK